MDEAKRVMVQAWLFKAQRDLDSAQRLADLTGAAERLTQYATLFRYPGAQLEPSQAEYDQAYQEASQFVGVTLALIPAEAHSAS